MSDQRIIYINKNPFAETGYNGLYANEKGGYKLPALRLKPSLSSETEFCFNQADNLIA